MRTEHNERILKMIIEDKELEGTEKINHTFSEMQKIPEIKEFIEKNKKRLFNRGLIENECYEIRFTSHNTEVYLSKDFVIA